MMAVSDARSFVRVIFAELERSRASDDVMSLMTTDANDKQ